MKSNRRGFLGGALAGLVGAVTGKQVVEVEKEPVKGLPEIGSEYPIRSGQIICYTKFIMPGDEHPNWKRETFTVDNSRVATLKGADHVES